MSYDQQTRMKANSGKSCVTRMSIVLILNFGSVCANDCEQGSRGTSKCFFQHDETAMVPGKMVSLSQ